MGRDTLLARLDDVLSPGLFRDYGPNGLQVQGKDTVRHLVTGVTASLALIEAAVQVGADALLVHHGLFWRGYEGRITGWMHRRIKTLMTHDLNLLAYHLPLDAHPMLGNNAQLARVLGFESDLPADDARAAQGFRRFGEQSLGFLGRVGDGAQATFSVADLTQRVQQRLGRAVTCVGETDRPVRTVAWCTGGAQGYFEAAMAAGADAFLTGEISEPQAHYARECGVAFLACGHHATERYGVQAVGDHLAATLGLRHTFIDIDNPA
ncbi:Nif3-like dinuclear metal center hexameric protein [Hydrogenophaga soli]